MVVGLPARRSAGPEGDISPPGRGAVAARLPSGQCPLCGLCGDSRDRPLGRVGGWRRRLRRRLRREPFRHAALLGQRHSRTLLARRLARHDAATLGPGLAQGRGARHGARTPPHPLGLAYGDHLWRQVCSPWRSWAIRGDRRADGGTDTTALRHVHSYRVTNGSGGPDC